jgi:TetR/AcrR family transcriptional repressor of nem operon
MRYAAEHKQKTRAKVLQVAARAIREDGPDRVGVAAVMAEAGLTHGGFYAHFRSKDALVAAAIEQMFEEACARVQHALGDRGPADGLAAYIDTYLSQKHRELRGRGCPMAALASDLPRLPDDARAAFAAGAQRLAGILAEPLAALGHADADAAAHSLLAELVGTLTLARAEPDDARAAALFAGARRMLRQRLGL